VLIDIHAHFLHDRSPRADWQARNASRLRDEFFPKSALDPNTVKGMDGLMTEAVNLKYMSRVLTPTELAEFVQVPLK